MWSKKLFQAPQQLPAAHVPPLLLVSTVNWRFRFLYNLLAFKELQALKSCIIIWFLFSSTTATTAITVQNSCELLCINKLLSIMCHFWIKTFVWNQIGVIIAGTSAPDPVSNQLGGPACIYIEARDTLYICDTRNFRIQMWTTGAANGITVIDTTVEDDRRVALISDTYGYLCISDDKTERLLRYAPISTNRATVAGYNGISSSALYALNSPMDIAVDGNLNLYIADSRNQRVMKWGPNATNCTTAIGSGSTSRFHGLLFSSYSLDAVWLSSENDDSVYLWTFNASAASVTLTQVKGMNARPSFNKPNGIKYDLYGNLYVADRGNERVVMYCADSTLDIVVVGDTGSTSIPEAQIDVGLDSSLNL